MRLRQDRFDTADDAASRSIDVDVAWDVCRRVAESVLRHLLVAALLVSASPTDQIGAQLRAPVDGGRTTSLGQPRTWSWTAGAASASLSGGGDAPEVAQARLATSRAIGNPVVGALGIQFEAYAGARRGEADGGVRARLLIPFARLGIGADLNALDGRTRAMYSLIVPGRRGGLFLDGSVARFDYVPERNHSITVALEVPIFREIPTGRTRPARDRVRVTGPLATPAPPLDELPGVNAALQDVRDAARRIRVLAVPFLGRDPPPSDSTTSTATSAATGAALPRHLSEIRQAMLVLGPASDSGPPAVRTVESEARRFHDALDVAFAAALDRSAPPDGSRTVSGRVVSGRVVADCARSVLLADVLLPYNRLLGQSRERDTIRRYGHSAQGTFMRLLHAEQGVSGREAIDALAVFSALLEIIEENRASIAKTWGDMRFAWLPLQYALRPEQHDSQDELDALIAHAVEEPFTEGNFVSYVINEQFQYQLSRTIRAAEDYHVLITHDFRGTDDVGDPDEMSYRQVVHSYLRALTDRVNAYDSTGRFPTYLILHDQWYYSVRHGALFLKLLEDPARYRLRLPPEFRAWHDTIAAAQDELRAAIAGSSLLQAQRRQYGDAWLRDLVKVHVNVTNRPDQTFWSWRLIRGLPMGDLIMRDHRKLVFYDISEEDPYRGEALYTGAGVGEHYSSTSWEDRSLLVRGPVLLGLKQEVRALLRGHGIRPERIPSALQPLARAAGYDERVRQAVAASEWPLRALGVHNGSGYAAKRVNVAKAVLYSLMPSGSVIIVPDSFWASDFWGSALFGASLRGVRVLVIAPSNASNSVAFFGTQLLSREILSRLLVARSTLAGELAATGGQMRVGLYDSELRVDDIPGKVSAARRTFDESGWLRDLFGFPPRVYADLAELEQRLRRLLVSRGGPGGDFEAESRTKLHLKANFFASREAWTLMALPNWGEMSSSFVDQRIAQVQSREALTQFLKPLDPLLDIGSGTVSDWHESLDPSLRERVVFYTVMGSQNQNYRSMVTDAEDALVVANWPSVIPYLDAISLVGQSRWVESQAELDALIPPVNRLKVFLAHWGRLVF